MFAVLLRIRNYHIFEIVKSLFKQSWRGHVHLQEGQDEGEEGDGGRQPQQETESGGPS